MKSILVTGGAGYIGSHAARELARSGYRPITLDNLSKGHEQAVLDGDFIRGELADEELLESIFQKHSVDAVMHFAALCEVGESVENPRRYYEQNVVNSLTLLRVMLRHDVGKFILSSTCATYGDPQRIPIDERNPSGLLILSLFWYSGESQYDSYHDQILPSARRSFHHQIFYQKYIRLQ